MPENENYARDFTAARLWVTMDNFQYHVFMATGLLCPNLRAYWDYYSAEAYEKMWNTILLLWETETLFNTDECNMPSNFAHGRYGIDKDHETGHFWNLTLHELHKDSVHYFLQFFNLGGRATNGGVTYYRRARGPTISFKTVGSCHTKTHYA